MRSDLLRQLEHRLHPYWLDTASLQRLHELPESIWYMWIAGAQAEHCWKTLHAAVPATGYWPVICGHEKEFIWMRQHFTDHVTRSTSVARILTESATIDADAWLQMALAENDTADGPWDTTEGANAVRGVWPTDMAPATTLAVPYDWQTQEPYAKVAIGFVPTQTSWQIPAYLRFGDYNACPSPAEHVCLLRKWEKQFGAEIISMTHDTIELRVASPPITRDAAIALAYEQFAYCPDIVDQGVGTLDALAATLLYGTVWYFWWD